MPRRQNDVQVNINAEENVSSVLSRLVDNLASFTQEAAKTTAALAAAGGMTNPLAGQMDALAKSQGPVQEGFRQTEASADSLQSKLSAFSVTVGILVADAFKKLGSTILKTMQSAVVAGGDATEALGKFFVTFGPAADSLSDSLDEFAAAAGRSGYVLKEMGANMGAVLKAMGFGYEEAGKMSDQIVKLAVDVGSFYNVAAPEALHKMEAALAGNTEGLRSLGVVISAEMVKQEAYASGLVRTGEELDQQSKAIATMNLMLRAKADAIGDAERTADSWANQMVRADGIWTDFITDIGLGLTEALGPLQQRIISMAEDGLPQLGEILISEVVPAIADAVQKMLDFILVIGDTIRWFQELDPAAVRFAAGMTAIGVGIPLVIAGVTALKAGVIGLTAAIAANPIGLIAVGIVAAGMGIAAVIDKINTKNAEMAAEQATVANEIATTAQTYDEYAVSVANAYVPMKDFAEVSDKFTLEQWVVELHGVRDASIMTREEFENFKKAAADAATAKYPADRTWVEDVAGQSTEAAEAIEKYGREAKEKMKQAHDEMAANAKEFSKAMADALKTGLTELMQMRIQHHASVAAAENQFNVQQANAAFAHQIQQLQARANYEAESLRLVQAGKEDELNNLTAKFQAAEANATQAYAHQQRMAQMNYVQQQMMQKQAYIAELKAQRNKTILSIAETAIQYNAEGKLHEDTLPKILGILKKGQSAQLQQQIDHAANVGMVSSQMSAGLVEDAQATVDGINAAYDKDIAGAEAELAKLGRDFDKIRDEILANIRAEQVPEDFGFEDIKVDGGAADRAARQATEPATRALSDVVKQIDEGIKSAKSAIKELLRFEIPAGVEEGLDKFGEFVTLSVNKLYAIFEDPDVDLKGKLDTFKKHLAPAADALRFIGTKLGVDVLKEMPDLNRWQNQMRVFFTAAFDFLNWIVVEYATSEAEDAPTALERVAAVVGDVMKVVEILKVDLDSIRPGGHYWARRFQTYLQNLSTAVERIRRYIQEEILDKGLAPSVEAAAEMIDSIIELTSLLGVTMDIKMPSLSLQHDLPEFLFAVFTTVRSINEMARSLAGQPRADELEERLREVYAQFEATASVAGDIADMLGILDATLRVNMPRKGWDVDLDAFLRDVINAATAIALRVHTPFSMGGMSSDVYEQELALLYEWFANAVPIIGDIMDIIGILDVDLSINVPSISPEKLEKRVGDLMRMVIGAATAIQAVLADPEVWLRWGARQDNADEKVAELREQIESNAEFMSSLSSTIDILNADLSFKMPSVSVSQMAAKAKQFMSLVIGAVVAIQDVLTDPEVWLNWGARQDNASEKMADLRLAIQASADEVDGILKMVSLLGVNLDFDLPKVGFGDKVTAFIESLIDATHKLLEGVQEVAEDPRWEGMLGSLSEAAEHIISVMDVLNIDLSVERAGPNFMARVVKHFENLKDAAPYVKDGIDDLVREWGDIDAMTAQGDIAEQINRVFSIFELGELFAGLEVEKALKEGEKRLPLMTVIDRILAQMKEAAPKLRDGLKEVNDLFNGALEESAKTAETLAKVFEALAKVVSTGASMAGEEGWRLPSVLRMIGEIAQASAAVSTIPEPQFGPPVPGGAGADAEASQVHHTLTLTVLHQEPSGEFTEHVVNVTLDRVDAYLGELVI